MVQGPLPPPPSVPPTPPVPPASSVPPTRPVAPGPSVPPPPPRRARSTAEVVARIALGASAALALVFLVALVIVKATEEGDVDQERFDTAQAFARRQDEFRITVAAEYEFDGEVAASNSTGRISGQDFDVETRYEDEIDAQRLVGDRYWERSGPGSSLEGRPWRAANYDDRFLDDELIDAGGVDAGPVDALSAALFSRPPSALLELVTRAARPVDGGVGSGDEAGETAYVLRTPLLPGLHLRDPIDAVLLVDGDDRPRAVTLSVDDDGVALRVQIEFQWVDAAVVAPGDDETDPTPWVDEGALADPSAPVLALPADPPDGFALAGVEWLAAHETVEDCDQWWVRWLPTVGGHSIGGGVGDDPNEFEVIDAYVLPASCALAADETPFAAEDGAPLPSRHDGFEWRIADDVVVQVDATLPIEVIARFVEGFSVLDAATRAGIAQQVTDNWTSGVLGPYEG